MDSIYKGLLVLLSVIAILLTGSSIAMSSAEIARANDYFDSAAAVIVDSNYNEQVMEQCCEEAELNGYRLEIEVQGETKPGGKKTVKATFTYVYEMKAFFVSKEKVKVKIL